MCEIVMMQPVQGHSCTKQWAFSEAGWRLVADYDLGWQFVAVPHAVASVDDIAEIVAGIEETRLDVFAVRGAIIDPNSPNYLRRKIRGLEAGLKSIDRQWMMLDLDKVEIPVAFDIHDVSDHPFIVDHAVAERLPSPFHDVRMFYQFSSSTGLRSSKVCGLHFWCWLDRPYSDDFIRKYVMSDAPGVDHKLFSGNQPHYLRSPILTGAPDPIPARSGWRDGCEDYATLPARSRWSRRHYEPSAGASQVSATRSNAAGSRWLAEALAQIGDDASGFHEPVRNVTWQYARKVATDLIKDTPENEGKLIAALQRRISLAVRGPARTADEIDRYASAEELQRRVRSAIAAAIEN